MQYKCLLLPMTLTNDSHISAMVTVTLSHTTRTALCHIRLSPCTDNTSNNWPTSLSKVSITNGNCTWNTKQAAQDFKDLLCTCMKELTSLLFTFAIIDDSYIPDIFIFSCLHTTSASVRSHPLSHTVPQNPSTQISTLPSLSLSPPTRRRSPELHSDWEVVFPWQITLATEPLKWWS